MIREVKREDIGECLNIIRQSFITVADEFGFTPANAPRFTAFATTEDRLIWQMDNENMWYASTLELIHQIILSATSSDGVLARKPKS
ncbi:MAG: hypothetical protein E7301_10960 [Butyrivibrio sp.]|nr:hypothetical protein [Butyrivibrio sp.]